MAFLQKHNLFFAFKRYFCNKSDSLPWKESASLMIVSKLNSMEFSKNVIPGTDTDRKFACDYNLLMVKRNELSSFMANAFVYPGGQIDTSDFSSDWWKLFDRLKITKKMLVNFSSMIEGVRPPIISHPLIGQIKSAELVDPLPSDIAFRIAAIRETFEETGLLLVTDPIKEAAREKLQNVNLESWQKKLRTNSANFMEMCSTLNMCPDIWSLFEWSNWLTPKEFGPKRFDTIFYICFLPYLPHTSIDNQEITGKKWCSPEDILYEAYSKNSFFLPPPQVYELSRLLTFDSYHELKRFSQQRQSKGTEQWLPLIYKRKDHLVSLLPGDDLYSSDVNGITEDDLHIEVKHFNRLKKQIGQQMTFNCNIAQLGHVIPIKYIPNNC